MYPQRSKQIKPTQQEVRDAWHRLRAKANTGDLLANALVIALTSGNVRVTGTPEFVASAAELADVLLRKIGSLPDDSQ